MKTIKNMITVAVIAILYAVAFCSCSSTNSNLDGIKLFPTSEGCVGVGTDIYNVAICPNGDIITTWKQAQLDGTIITAKAIKPKNGKVRIMYEQNGIFIAYDASAKSTVTIGAVPTSAEQVVLPAEVIIP